MERVNNAELQLRQEVVAFCNQRKKNRKQALTTVEITKYLELERSIAQAARHHNDTMTEKLGDAHQITEAMFLKDGKRPKWIIDPDSKVKRAWDIMIIALVCFNALLIPYAFAFRSFSLSHPSFWEHPEFPVVIFEYIIDMVFVADIVLNFRTGFLRSDNVAGRGVKCYEVKEIVANYLKPWFFIDLMAVIPFELLTLPLPDSEQFDTFAGFSRFFRLFRLAKVQRQLDRLNQGNFEGGAGQRIGRLVFVFFLLVHVAGCMWFWVGTIQDEGNRITGGPWIKENNLVDAPVQTQMVASLYFALTTMTSVGYGDILPYTTTERYFAMTVQIIGAISFANLFGIVSSILIQFDASNARFRDRMELIREFVTHYKLPESLTEQIFSHFEALWEVKKGMDVHVVMADLPLQLQETVMMSMMQDVCTRTPLLYDVERSFTEVFVMGMQQQVCLPGIHIVEEDETGKEIFILHIGVMEAVKNDMLIQLFVDGTVFNIDQALSGHRAPCTIRGVTKCDLYTMSKTYLQEVLAEFPEEAKIFEQYGKAQTSTMSARIKAVLPELSREIVLEEKTPDGRDEPLIEGDAEPPSPSQDEPPPTKPKFLGMDEAKAQKRPKPRPNLSQNVALAGRLPVMYAGEHAYCFQQQMDTINARIDTIEKIRTELTLIGQRVNSLMEYTLYSSDTRASEKQFQLVTKKLDLLSEALINQQMTLAVNQ